MRSTNAYTRQGTFLPQQMPERVADVQVHVVSEANILSEEDLLSEEAVIEEQVGSVVAVMPDRKREVSISLGLKDFLIIGLMALVIGLYFRFEVK